MPAQMPTFNRTFAIRSTNHPSPACCPLCDSLIDPLAGPELFVSDPWQPVCWACGVIHAPDLVEALFAYYHVDVALGIKLNTDDAPVPCTLCEAVITPRLGPELFLAESQALVCRSCGELHAP